MTDLPALFTDFFNNTGFDESGTNGLPKLTVSQFLAQVSTLASEAADRRGRVAARPGG